MNDGTEADNEHDPGPERTGDASRPIGDRHSGSPGGPEGPGGSDGTDRFLRAAGAELRESAPHMDGSLVVEAANLRAQLRRARRASYVAIGVAAALIAATVGFVLTDGQSAEVASGVGGVSPGAAEAIVSDLPPEPVDPHDVELVASVRTFGSCDALGNDLRTVGAAHVGSYGFGSNRVVANAEDGLARSAASDTSDGSPEAAPGTGGQLAFTGPGTETLGTNVIVEGVDEPDRVKASGSLVVDLTPRSDLRVIDTTTASIIGTLNLAQPGSGDDGDSYAQSESLLLVDDRAVVFGSEAELAPAIEGDPSAARPTIDYTTVTFVDLSDPAKPNVTERVRLEGNLVAARRVEGEVRMVMGSTMADLPLVNPTNPSSVPVALEQNRLAVASSSVDDWIPAWDHGSGSDSQRLIACDKVSVPDTFAGVSMTSLVSFELAGPFTPEAAGILAPSDDITATATDVVVASHIWVDPADRTDDFEDWSSALHRFSFADEGPDYVASGKVRGSIRDDFSMSVLDGSSLGVLTVDELPWEQRDQAKVTVRTLGIEGDSMPELDSFDVAQGGSGTSGMRFMGDRLIVSSGIVGNHLTVVDLADRAALGNLGEVDIEGSGAYFHPLADDRVLVVGQAWRKVGDDPNIGAAPIDLSITLLDISGAPQVLSTSETRNTMSNVGGDHHEFTWWPERSTAAFGVSHQSEQPFVPAPPPQAFFIDVGADGPVPLMVTPTEADLGPKCPPTQMDRTGCDDTGPPSVDRVLVVDGQVWLHTSESLEHLDVGASGPITGATSLVVVPLPPF